MTDQQKNTAKEIPRYVIVGRRPDGVWTEDGRRAPYQILDREAHCHLWPLFPTRAKAAAFITATLCSLASHAGFARGKGT